MHLNWKLYLCYMFFINSFAGEKKIHWLITCFNILCKICLKLVTFHTRENSMLLVSYKRIRRKTYRQKDFACLSFCWQEKIILLQTVLFANFGSIWYLTDIYMDIWHLYLNFELGKIEIFISWKILILSIKEALFISSYECVQYCIGRIFSKQRRKQYFKKGLAVFFCFSAVSDRNLWLHFIESFFF